MTREDIEKKMHEAAEEIKPLITTLVEALCEAHQKGYLAGVKLGAETAYPQWIPVEERLPKENEEVLAYNAENEEVIACDYHHKMFHCWPEAFNESITHWMSMPQLPRKED